MPAALTKSCSTFGCPETAPCPTHHKRPVSDFAWVYHSVLWQRFRWSILQQRPLCEHCRAKSQTTPSNEVHHLRALRLGGEPFDPRNVAALCRPCHSRETVAGR